MQYARRCRINSKGQVCVPKIFRAALGVNGATDIEIDMDHDGVITLRGTVSPDTEKTKTGRPSMEAHWLASDIRSIKSDPAKKVIWLISKAQ